MNKTKIKWPPLGVVGLIFLLPVMARSQAPMKPTIEPAADLAALMPRHGTVSIHPARRWEDGLAVGNGIMGGLLFGDPIHDTLIVDHCKLWLPLGSREVVPNVGAVLPEMRRVIGEKGYSAGRKVFLDEARRQGWNGKLVWTDPFHPGFFLSLQQPQPDPVTHYARVEDFSTGEARVQWTSGLGDFERRIFVSRPDNVMVVTTRGPRGRVSLTITMDDVANPLIESNVTQRPDEITCHNVYTHGKGGYDGVVRVLSEGGSRTGEGRSISITGANSVTLLIRIQPWKTPLEGSDAWPYSDRNPDFHHPSETAGLYRAAAAYHPRWMTDLEESLRRLPTHYDQLFKPHAAAWSRIYNRVSVDLGGSPDERKMPSEALLDLAQREQRLPAALLERMYDAGRYVFMCSAGPETPPNLFGVWTGTWRPAWSGDYTTDTNLELDVECAYSGNMAELMEGYFNLWDSYIPDFQLNATRLYGCRGILTGSRASNLGLDLHWDSGWPGEIWTPGASWIAHWYDDYYRYTGDRRFLRDRAVPFMEQCALFWEDFLKGTEDSTGHYTFRPSYSAENGAGDNASQDIEIVHELLTNLVDACETLGVKADGVARWKAMLVKLPPLLINSEGQLKEWSNPNQGEKNDHRHLMHLYGAFESGQFSEEADPVLWKAARVALNNRVAASHEDATHGYMHTALAAVGLGMGNLAFARIEELAKRRSIFVNMVDGHYGGPRILCDDGNGATPEIINRMVIQSAVGRLALLPALPAALPHGEINGTGARGQILVNQVRWNVPGGVLGAAITSAIDQDITLVLPPGAQVISLEVDGKPVQPSSVGVSKQGCSLHLHQGRTARIEAKLAFAQPGA